MLKEAELVEVDYNCGKWSKLKENFVVYRNKTIELKEELKILGIDFSQRLADVNLENNTLEVK